MSTLLETRLQQMEARVRNLENIEEVRRVLGLYCKALDARDAQAMGALLSRDVQLVVVPWNVDIKGHKGVMEFFVQYFQSDWKEPRHNCANESITPEGDGYHSFCYFHETLSRGEDSVLGWGTWEDRCVLEDGRWKIGRRLITVMALTPITRGWAMADKIMPL
jgi:ketosteroid isomerase-like protein